MEMLVDRPVTRDAPGAVLRTAGVKGWREPVRSLEGSTCTRSSEPHDELLVRKQHVCKIRVVGMAGLRCVHLDNSPITAQLAPPSALIRCRRPVSSEPSTEGGDTLAGVTPQPVRVLPRAARPPARSRARLAVRYRRRTPVLRGYRRSRPPCCHPRTHWAAPSRSPERPARCR